MLREYTRRLDAAGEDSYLETEKPENVALYQRFGYEVIEEAEVLGVPNWFMWRDAAPAPRDPARGRLNVPEYGRAPVRRTYVECR